MSDILSERGRLAALSRSRSDDDPELLGTKQRLAAAKIEAYVERVVANAPPLTAEQCARVTELLRPVGIRCLPVEGVSAKEALPDEEAWTNTQPRRR